MDNAVPGAKDLNLANLESAALEIALFKESVVYHGLPQANIIGLKHCADQQCLTIKSTPEQLLEAIAEGLTVFADRSVDGPFAFVVGPKLQSAHLQGYPVKMQAENILGGTVMLSTYLTGDFEMEAYMVAQRGGDLEIILGNNLAIGYDSHTTSTVSLCFTESFTLSILDAPASFILPPRFRLIGGP